MTLMITPAGGTGTVTSVGGTGTVAGISLSGTVTTSGNLSLSGTLSTPVSTINDSTTVGQNLVKLADPSAITFLRVNANNTVSALDAATFRTAIGAGTSSTTGTVTSVAALTLGTTGTDVSSTVANGSTTPVITLNLPTASATARGLLSSADWTTFNNKGSGTVTSVSVATANGFAGTVATASSTPAITLTTSISGILKGNGTAISAATAGTDYLVGTATTPGTYNSVTVNANGLVTAATVKQAPNVQVIAAGSTAATITPNADTDDMVAINGHAAAFTVAAPSGTSTNGEKLLFRIKDNGTARAITWNAVYVNGGATPPTTTVAGKIHHVGFVYNGGTSSWYCIAATVEA